MSVEEKKQLQIINFGNDTWIEYQEYSLTVPGHKT